MAISLILRSVKGAPLTTAEMDGNLTALRDAIQGLIDNPLEPVAIVGIVVNGTQMTFQMSDGSTLGPVTLPTLSRLYEPSDPQTATLAAFSPIRADAQTFYNCTSATGTTVTIPTEANIAFSVGTEIHFRQDVNGQTLSIVGATGVTVLGTTSTTVGGAVLTAKKIGTDLWVVWGAAAASGGGGGGTDGAAFQQFCGCRLHSTAAALTLTTTPQALQWNTEVFDTDGWFDAALDPYSVVVPAAADGKYVQVTANLRFKEQNVAPATVTARIRNYNATMEVVALQTIQFDQNGYGYVSLTSPPMLVAAGDPLAVEAYVTPQQTGTVQTYRDTSIEPSFAVHVIGAPATP